MSVLKFRNSTSDDWVEIFTIQGEPGEKGDPGETGPQGPQGPAGADGADGVYVGTTEPADENIKIWLDPSGEPDEFLTAGEVEALIDEKLGVIVNGQY